MRAARAMAVAAGLMVLLTACAETGTWQNVNLPREQWALDQADCERRARNQAERELALSEQSRRPVTSGRMDNPTVQWQSDMDRFSAQKREGRLFESCMTAKGYTLVPDDGTQAAEDAAPAPSAGQGDPVDPGRHVGPPGASVPPGQAVPAGRVP
jgi:hypothetical protein